MLCRHTCQPMRIDESDVPIQRNFLDGIQREFDHLPVAMIGEILRRVHRAQIDHMLFAWET